MKIFPVIFIAIFLSSLGAFAQATNTLSDAETQGRGLAQKILDQHPTQDLTQSGFLKFVDANKIHVEFSMECQIIGGADDSWSSIYKLSNTNNARRIELVLHHYAKERNRYIYNYGPLSDGTNGLLIAVGAEGINDSEIRIRSVSFAGSDFWITDLGLEFFHWPLQKVLKKDVHRGQGCTVLESTNPNPSTNSYSRVVSWIDNESLGIVEAFAYDANGKKLKDFYPKDFKKVNGQWQVQTLVMENLQTGSRSRIEFDLKK